MGLKRTPENFPKMKVRGKARRARREWQGVLDAINLTVSAIAGNSEALGHMVAAFVQLCDSISALILTPLRFEVPQNGNH